MGEEKPKSLLQLVTELPTKLFKRDALALLVACVAGGTGVVYAQAQARAAIDAGVVPVAAEVARVAADVERVKAEQAEARRDIERVKAVTLETNLNVRLLAERLGVQPVKSLSEVPRDGGQ